MCCGDIGVLLFVCCLQFSRECLLWFVCWQSRTSHARNVFTSGASQDLTSTACPHMTSFALTAWPATDLIRVWDTGGDAFISICTWQAGYAMTDPGYSFFHPDVNMFDPGPEDRMGNMMKLVRALDHRCDVACQVWPTLLCACCSFHAMTTMPTAFCVCWSLHVITIILVVLCAFWSFHGVTVTSFLLHCYILRCWNLLWFLTIWDRTCTIGLAA